ncbi:aminopeptidase P family protein [Hamadaea tsunoensis]|uniref:aminopeptidase P family protein n=1 Tax=Hamadaea tsunoensis TaxID=53368 RepID=UPI000425D53C|nr:aminopeptidase P family protein [Hamadaea tsunoensis]
MGAPFTADDFALRMERVARAAAGAGLDGLIVTPGPDLAYLCGYEPPINERLTALIVSTGAEPVLVVPRLERPDAEKCPGGSQLRLVDWPDGRDPYAVAAQILPGTGGFAISDSAWSLHLLGLQAAAPGVAYTSMTRALPMLRAVKDDAELARLAAAGAAADAAFADILGVRFAGRTELQVAADLGRALVEHGHSSVDFTLVCSGPNGANPHHRPGDRVIAEGDAIVLDFGGSYQGYGSDTTRTVSVGEPSAEVAEVHAVVRRAQQAAFEAVRPGVPSQEIDRVARAVIRDAGFGDHFIHRTGHGIGMSTHEPPYIVEGEERPLVPGMCFSIEPGVYLSGRFGVRIEDIVTVTETGGARFNNSPRDLAIVS